LSLQRVHTARSAARPAAAALLAGAAALCGCGGGDEPVRFDAATLAANDDRVVAEVNGAPVFASQVEAIRQAERLRMGAAGRTPVEIELEDHRIRDEALRLAVNAELCFQAARASGMEIDGVAVDERMAGIRSQFAGNEEFESYLAAAGLDLDTLRARTARKMLIRRYVQSIADDLALDEAAADQIYEEQGARFSDHDEVRAAQIVVRVLPDAPADQRAAARAKIDEAWARLEAGEPFAEVAARYSESPFAERGGDLGFIQHGRLLPELEAVVFGTPVGEVTPIFETRHGFNIVTVLERREGRAGDPGEVKGALLMLQARDRRDAALADRIEQLRAEATIRLIDDDDRDEAAVP
jgi:parvulin-like peptidyl-prolyl isomerase